jgi:hypothetical protein
VEPFFVVAFGASLRGNEGFMVETQGLLSHLGDGDGIEETHPHVVIPLVGRFNNEVGERWHLVLLVSVTHSGFNIRLWVERLAKVLMAEGKTSGPAFCNHDGTMLGSTEVDSEFKK